MALPSPSAIFFFQRPQWALAGSFLGLITVGAILLSLPISHGSQRIGILDALFTSTSAVCITGLVVVDTGTAFSRFGQSVIMILIQLGGLGIMTFAVLGTQLLGRRLSLQSQAMIADTFWQSDAAGTVRRDLKRIIGLTLLIEFIGMIFLYGHFRHVAGYEHPPVFSAAFHAVSAFCNAGFALQSDSVMSFRSSPLVMFVIMALVFLGGIGHSVTLEAVRRGIARITGNRMGSVNWTLHSRVVLSVSIALIIAGALLLLLTGADWETASWGQRSLDVLFQSVASRTAGFNSVDTSHLPLGALLIFIFLMFIGGAPASCAGGIKVTSAAVYFAEVRARLTGAREAALFGRRLPMDVIAKATLVIGLSVLWNLIGCLLLTITERAAADVHLQHLLFEQVSAFGTVGLSTGITPELSTGGRIWIILSMFVGRIGPLTAAMAMMPRETGGIRYPEERLMIG